MRNPEPDQRQCAGAGRRRKAAAPELRPWVVKLGGSLSRSPRLTAWLRALAASQVPLAVVPGGGPFADQVRDSQAFWRFDDAAAHHMALLAMDQTGRMFAALEPRLHICTVMADFAAAFAAGRPAVWLPTAMAQGQDDIAESWDVTSDSLAAWLAIRIGAAGVVLVKSVEPPAGETGAAELARGGLVDPAFGRSLSGSGIETWCAGPDRPDRVVAALAGGDMPACRIRVDR